jgi:hypothetical protein
LSVLRAIVSRFNLSRPGVPARINGMLFHELATVSEMLTVYDAYA